MAIVCPPVISAFMNGQVGYKTDVHFAGDNNKQFDTNVGVNVAYKKGDKGMDKGSKGKQKGDQYIKDGGWRHAMPFYLLDQKAKGRFPNGGWNHLIDVAAESAGKVKEEKHEKNLMKDIGKVLKMKLKGGKGGYKGDKGQGISGDQTYAKWRYERKLYGEGTADLFPTWKDVKSWEPRPVFSPDHKLDPQQEAYFRHVVDQMKSTGEELVTVDENKDSDDHHHHHEADEVNEGDHN